MVRREQTARFIEPMECLPGEHIPEVRLTANGTFESGLSECR